MQQTKRPLLRMGLILTTILALCYIISQIFNLTSWIILVLYVAVFFFNMAALKTVNMSKSEFKKGKWYSWASIILVFIYNIFEFARILNDKNNIGVMDSTMVFGTISSGSNPDKSTRKKTSERCLFYIINLKLTL